ncbi:hypothetical protein LROSL1_1620 [Furfurilactobacillus rossiae]|uniref:antitoxin of toxin-antitoxin stability system n=1 Tax=Furfurilactobacillus rossiae TaxID=231049 RepID=UPI0015BAB4F0|nr:antitoxin of toxin-antitoxin stability system [Furfurilactobacillus rossiae]MCF6165870.1 antitoxin of toxin-antitoxin stability system [Furfurilactobacillus rossiae]QLE64437.1 hypothetical protein LROSL1_1620 [Furfurilactobacillus rossiae]
MRTVKIQTIDSHNFLPLPFDIHPKNDTFDVLQGRDGAVIYLPEGHNPFTDKEYVTAHSGSELDEGFNISPDEFV